MCEAKGGEERTPLALVPLAIAALSLIAVGWVGHALLRKTRFRRVARLARKMEVTGQRTLNLAEREVRPLFSDDEAAV